MNEDVPPLETYATRSGTIQIEASELFEPLQTAASATGSASDAYWLGCAIAQFWADLRLAATIGNDRAETRRMLAGLHAEASDYATRMAHALLLGHRSQEPPRLATIRLSSAGGEWLSLIEKAVSLPLPECCGYDLGDLHVCVSDATRFSTAVDGSRRTASSPASSMQASSRSASSRPASSRPILVIGIRSGGSSLAPIWYTALTSQGNTRVQWTTVRPLEAGCHPEEIRSIVDWAAESVDPVFVIVDDQPDTGATMETIATGLRSLGGDIWYASIGRVWRDDACRRIAVSAQPPLSSKPKPALWQLLSKRDHPQFLDLLSSIPDLPPLPKEAEIRIRCSALERRYGRSEPWRPWQDVSPGEGGRALINPRKTPLTVIDGNGAPRLHLRFIGEGVFGLAEHRRVAALSGGGPAWFLDGYRIVPDLGATVSLRESLTFGEDTQRQRLFAACAEWMRRIASTPAACSDGIPGLRQIGHELRKRLDRLNQRFGLSLRMPTDMPGLADARVPAWGRASRAIRSSLRYSHGHWHWQLDAAGAVHRFQLEANWGGVSCAELEIASFVLEQRLDASDAQEFSLLCGLRYAHVVEQLPAAALVALDALTRSVRKVDVAGLERLRSDVDETFEAIGRLNERLNC